MSDNRWHEVGIVLVLAAALGLSANAAGDWRRGFVDQRSVDRSNRGAAPPVSLDRAVADIRSRERGRVLSADSVQRGGRDVHRIKILTEKGRVRNVYMDPQTGKIIRR